MRNSKAADEEKGETLPLSPPKATPESVNNDPPDPKCYKRLAICSMICGCSCFAYKALEYYFKGEQTQDIDEVKKLFKKSRNYSIIAMVTGIGIIISIFALTFLISYILTLFD